MSIPEDLFAGRTRDELDAAFHFPRQHLETVRESRNERLRGSSGQSFDIAAVRKPPQRRRVCQLDLPTNAPNLDWALFVWRDESETTLTRSTE